MSARPTTDRIGGATDEHGAPPPTTELRPLPQLSPSEISSVLRRLVLEYGEDLALGLVSSALRCQVRKVPVAPRCGSPEHLEEHVPHERRR